MDPPKLEWMYRNSSEVVDREEYLLGRPVDKAFEQTTLGNEIEKDCLPTPVLSNTSSNIQVDVVRKLKEDPLEIIRQQEIERRKQLLKNPVKLKKLQKMLKEKEENRTVKKKKKSRKKRASSESRSDASDNNSKDIDSLLTKKYTSLMKKFGIKSLSDLADLKVEKKKKKKKRERSEESDSESQSESEKEKGKNKRKARRKYDSSSTSDCDSEFEAKSRYRRKHREASYDDGKDHSNRPLNKDKRKQKSRSPSPRSKKSSTKDSSSQSSSHRNRDKERYEEKNRGSRYDSKHNEGGPKRKQGLSEEEKKKRLEEMMENAKWRDEVRVKNVTRYRKEDAAENKESEYNEDFLRKQMAIATSHGSVETRIKSNINNIQRSKFSMNENFARR